MGNCEYAENADAFSVKRTPSSRRSSLVNAMGRPSIALENGLAVLHLG